MSRRLHIKFLLIKWESRLISHFQVPGCCLQAGHGPLTGQDMSNPLSDMQDSNLGLVSKIVKLILFSDISTFYITHILSGHWAVASLKTAVWDLEMTNETAFPIY